MRMGPFLFDPDAWTEKVGAGGSPPWPGYSLVRHASVNLTLAAVFSELPGSCRFTQTSRATTVIPMRTMSSHQLPTFSSTRHS